MWQLWGEFMLLENAIDTDGGEGAYESAKRFGRTAAGAVRRAASKATRTLARQSERVRLIGADINGVQVSLTFHRIPTAASSEYSGYTLQSLSIHVPAGVPGEFDTEFRHTLTAHQKLSQGNTRNILKDVELGESRVEPTEAAQLEQVLALAAVLQDHHEHCRNLFIESQHIAIDNPDEAEKAKRNLDELSRIRNVIDAHADVLRSEEDGLVLPQRISVEVEDAIAKGDELIRISLSERWKRARETRTSRKSASVSTNAKLKEDFLRNVAALETTRAAGGVGSAELKQALAG